MRRVITLVLAVLFIPWMVNAQKATQRLSLQEAVQFALDYNKELQASQMDIEIYQKKIMEAISQGLPQINGTLTYSTNFNYAMELGGMSMKMQDQSTATGSVSQLIFSGQWIVGIQTSRLAKELIEKQVDVTEQGIVENIYNSYYTILSTKRMLEILEQNLENVNTLYEHTHNMFQVGVVEETDLDQLKITVGQLKNTKVSTERAVQLSYSLLKIQLGLNHETDVVLTDLLDSFLDESRINRLMVQPFNLEDNLNYQMIETQNQITRKQLTLEKWSYAPTIAGNYSYTHKIKKPDFDMSPKNAAALQMSVPIFSGLQRRSKVQQAKFEVEKSEINKALLEDQLNLQNDQLKFDLENALENYNLQKENIEIARKVLNSYKHKYEEGALSSMDFTQANNTYLQAENNYTSAMLTLLQAQLNLQKLHNQLSK